MDDKKSDTSAPHKDKNKKPSAEQKKQTLADKLRKKIDRLKKDDPNIYPIF